MTGCVTVKQELYHHVRTARRESANFPLDGCLTQEIDFLFLYCKNCYHQHDYTDKLVQTIKGPDINKSRLRFCEVYDRFSDNISNIDFSIFHFNASISSNKKTYFQNQDAMLQYTNISIAIRQKTLFVERFFSENDEIRVNVAHVAVIFIDSVQSSLEEIKRIPEIVQQHQVTHTKIFIAVIHNSYVNHEFSLTDTIIQTDDNYLYFNQMFLMAICKECPKGWFKFVHNDHIGSLSCYFVSDSRSALNWLKSLEWCSITSSANSLAKIETKEELNFLQTHLTAYHHKHSSDTTESSFQSVFHIGLKRDKTNIAKSFRWSLPELDRSYPLLFQHWLPGKPSDGFNECAVWQFTWSNTGKQIANVTSSDSRLVDGWVDVGCQDKITLLSLCEVALPRILNDSYIMRIKPASNESFRQALAKGGHMIYRGNIVSVSANVGSKEFMEFLKQTNQKFPIFDCGAGVPDPRYISYLYVCDSVDHCSNRRDEIFCVSKSVGKKNNEVFTNKCQGVLCDDGICLPLQWVGDGEVNCNLYSYISENKVNDEDVSVVSSIKKNKMCALYCDDKCVLFSQLNNTERDCIGPDGPLDETVGKLETTDSCYNILGHLMWAPKCVYVKDRLGAILGCRDMSHLQNCTYFVCPEGYVKCPNTYCVPQHYALDGTEDCPIGEDENYLSISSCIGNFACWNSKMCLHPDLVCNGYPDCPHGDDEIDCNVKCVEGLRCISGTIMVSDYGRLRSTLDWRKLDARTRYLDLSNVDLSNSPINHLHNLKVMILYNCSISLYMISGNLKGAWTIDMSYNNFTTVNGLRTPNFNNHKGLRHLNLSNNKHLIEVINVKLHFLENLDLSHTSLLHLGSNFFGSLPNLKCLNLSFTKITIFRSDIFPPGLTLDSLDLRGLFLKDFYEDFYNDLTISKDLYTANFVLCCPQIRGRNIPSHNCHAPDNAISSCFDLIGIDVQLVLLWVVAVLAVLGNITVISYRVIWDRSVLRTGYGLFVTNLGISDFIMGVYMFIIAGADYYYRDIYVLYDKSWRESVVCKLAGFLATLSSETSTFFVFLITLDRFLMMKFPFGQVQFSKVSKIIVLSLSWIIGFLLALAPILFKFEIYSSNAMCLGLPLTTKRLNGWEFSFAVFIVLNFCLFLLIVYGQRAIFRAMSENRATGVASRRAQDITVAKQLVLVALSNFLCWCPVGVMGLLSLGDYEISNEVYAWTTVIILPINSAANPILYTIPLILTKWEQFKHRDT